MLNQLAAWLFSAMTAWAPVESHAFTGAPREQTEMRYRAIASDMAAVALEETPVFAGGDGMARTALLALAIDSYESGGFAEKVDTLIPSGDCSSGKCRATCLAQLWLRPGERLEHRRDCFRIQFARIRESFASCRGLPLEQKLAVYASGTCTDGLSASETRFRRALRWWKAHPFLLTDG